MRTLAREIDRRLRARHAPAEHVPLHVEPDSVVAVVRPK